MHLPARLVSPSGGPILAASLLLAALVAAGAGCGRSGEAAEPRTSHETLRKTSLGAVQGFVSADGAHVWRGIPFASPPVGDLRWRSPQPARPWEGTRQALAFGASCVQFAGMGGARDESTGEPTGSEDCLYLNVYAPAWKPEEVPTGEARLPVMFWIHGGGNTVGNADPYDASLLAVRHDVIVVAVHYRLGVFGWFSHPALRTGGASPEDASGNYGTLDLVRALEWVQANAGAFGGDPGNVLVFGESAGGADTFSMLLSPLAKGLFHRAIVQSGGAGTTERAEAENYSDDEAAPGSPNSSKEVVARLLERDGKAADRATAKKVAAAMSPSDMASYLRRQSAEELLRLYDGSGMGGMYRAPDLIRDGHVLPEGDPLVVFERGEYNRVPTILGTNRDESKLFMAFTSDHVTKLFGLPLWLNDEGLYLAGVKYSTQMWKVRGVDAAADAMFAAQGPSVYAYRFDWDDEPDFLWLDVGTLFGAAHALEIPFVFGWLSLGAATPLLFDEDLEVSNRALSDAMMSYWSNFAYTGDPGRGRRGDLPPWKAWSRAAEAPKLMILDSEQGGGLRMSADSLSRDSVLAAIASDPRLAEPRDRCEVYYGLTRFGSVMDEEAYAELCPAHPIDDYPWRS